MIVSLEPQLLDRLSRLDRTAAGTVAAEEHDDELDRAVRRTAKQRIVLYVVVLTVALFGQASGAVALFELPWPVAIGAVVALEIGGVVFLSNADVRRRLGEHATWSRGLAVLIAAAAITFNLIAHNHWLMGGFFALMSFLGFVAFWSDMENKRRDRLRAKGQLAATSPAYEIWGHWVKHPGLTRKAKSLSKAYPQLGLYGSLEAAQIVTRRERRNSALADALQKRLKKTVGRDMAEIAILTYDMGEVAERLRAGADYDGLTAILTDELSSTRIGGHVTGRKPLRAKQDPVDQPHASHPSHTIEAIDAFHTRLTAPQPPLPLPQRVPAIAEAAMPSPIPAAATSAAADTPAWASARMSAGMSAPTGHTCDQSPDTESAARPAADMSAAAPAPVSVAVSAPVSVPTSALSADETAEKVDEPAEAVVTESPQRTSNTADSDAAQRPDVADQNPTRADTTTDEDPDDARNDDLEPTRTAKEIARIYWTEQIAAGVRPTGAELARQGGASDRQGRRWAKEWAAAAGLTLELEPTPEHPVNGAHRG